MSFDVGRGERLIVMGLNGAGKTSLLRILAGVTEPTLGAVRFGMGVDVGYYAQEHEGIRPGATLVEHMREEAPNLSESEQRGILGMFGLSGDKVFQDAATLSGGEKTKLALAQLVGGRHNLLLLDEPTNNLDPPSREAVADALEQLGGHVDPRQPRRRVRRAAGARAGPAHARRLARLLERRLPRAGHARLTAQPKHRPPAR